MAALVVFGLKFAPASHAAALGPGAIAAWIALLGYVVLGIQVPARRVSGIAIVAGVLLILAASGQGLSAADVLIGDAMFLAASALGASYPVSAAAGTRSRAGGGVGLRDSALVVVPWHGLFATSTIASAPLREVCGRSRSRA